MKTETTSRRASLASLALSMLLSSLGVSSASVALPVLARDFHVDMQHIQWVVLAYLLATTSLVVSAGRFGDHLGRRRVLLTGLALYTGASVLCALAPSLWILFAGRALQGAGAAAMMALTMALLADVAPGRLGGRAMGLLATMSAVGTALGPTLGGMLIAGFGWRAIFLINIPAGVCALALGWRSLPGADSASTHRAQAALAGPALLATSLLLYSLAMTGTTFSAVWLAGAALAATVFVRQQSKSASPLVQPGALRQSWLACGCAMHLLTATVLMAALVVGPFHLSAVLELGLLEVGLVMSCGPLVVAIAGIPAGIVVDRYGDSASTLAGLIIMTSACLALAFAPASLGIAGYVVPLMVFTGSYALFQTANNSAVMAHSSADQRGAVSGLLALARNLGLLTGASLMGNVFAVGAPSGRGLLATFSVGTVLLAAAIVLCLPGMRARRDNANQGSGVICASRCKK